MNKISINLLPQAVLQERIQSTKFSLVNKISIGILIAIILLTATILLLRINQNQESNQVNNEVKIAEDKIISLHDKEAVVFALKNRLDAISSKLGSDEKVKSMFNLIVYLTPPDVVLYDATVDKKGTITASFTSSSLTSINKLFSTLSNKETNFNLISSIDLSGISLGKDSIFRFSLRIVD